MKTFTTITLLIAIVVLFQSCDNDDDYTPPPLPYFFCKINGQNFAARGAWQCQSRTFNYYPNGFMNALPGTVVLDGYDCEDFIQVALGFSNFFPEADSFHNTLSSLDSSKAIVGFYDFEEPLIFDQLEDGFISFQTFSDRVGDRNGIVAGTFEFTVRNEETDSTIVIT